jgi:DNA-binding PadR family transcriptional regulator
VIVTYSSEQAALYADILILATLRSGPQHGYDIKKRIERFLGGSVPLNNKVLYPTLKRFEEMGALQRTVERQEGKPDRHVYHLTECGTEILQDLLREFTPELAGNDAEFYTRVAFFHLLEPEARLEILSMRTDRVAGKLAYLQDLRTLANADEAMSFAQRVLQFHEQRTRYEIAWLRELVEETRTEQKGQAHEGAGDTELAERIRRRDTTAADG